MLPAHAGMILYDLGLQGNSRHVTRTRGDDPALVVEKSELTKC